MVMNGRHEYTFANPYGIVYQIGCFTVAPGCLTFGVPSSEFAWFAGYSWQCAYCSKCGVHSGWFFRSEQRHFHGLIFGQLIEQDEEDEDMGHE